MMDVPFIRGLLRHKLIYSQGFKWGLETMKKTAVMEIKGSEQRTWVNNFQHVDVVSQFEAP